MVDEPHTDAAAHGASPIPMGDPNLPMLQHEMWNSLLEEVQTRWFGWRTDLALLAIRLVVLQTEVNSANTFIPVHIGASPGVTVLLANGNFTVSSSPNKSSSRNKSTG